MTPLYLVDTSAWILHFSKKSGFILASVCEPEHRALCLPVYQEILQGIRDESAFQTMRTALQSAIFIENPLSSIIYDEAVGLYRSARRQGLTIRSSVDCLIAACAIRHQLVVLHHDRDYPALAQVSSLRQQSIQE
ncbi:MAG: PIN domain-containing protein [Spirochaetota bacterium]